MGRGRYLRRLAPIRATPMKCYVVFGALNAIEYS